jgi:hypothetical protein
MGRRARARQREAAAAAAAAPAAAPARPRRRLVELLNPFRLKPPTRKGVRLASMGFALAAVVFAVLGWATGDGTWFNSAVLLAILSAAWGFRSVFMREDNRSS